MMQGAFRSGQANGEHEMSKLRMGIVGIGEMGRRHAENFRRLVPQAQLIAIADADEARAAKVAAELEIESSYSSVEALVERKDIDAVLISTPDKFHAGGIEAAARAGKHILAEKPLALSIESAQSALDAVARAGVILQIGFMRRYDAAYAAARQRIEAGEIGDLVAFKSIGRDKNPPPLSFIQSGVNGILLYGNTIHDFDLARWLTGDEVVEVHTFATASTRPEIEPYGHIMASSVNLRYSKGAIGNLESSMGCLYGYDVRTEIVGSKGSIFVGTIHQQPAMFLKPDYASFNLEDHYLSRFRDAYVTQSLDFVDTVRKGRQPRVTGEDGLRALKTAVAAEKSYRSKAACAVS
jgi:scyllo-inositol 2-dehydrogenase (NAD+)